MDHQQEDNQHQIEQIKKPKMRNVNTKITTQDIYTMKILIRNNRMGYYKTLKYIQISIKRKIKRTMKMQKKEMTLRIFRWIILRKR